MYQTGYFIGSSSLGGTGGFTRLVTPGPCGISRGARKLARTSTVIKKKCQTNLRYQE